MSKKTLLLIVGFVILWNSGFVGAEYGLPYADPFTLLFWRYLGLLLLLWFFLSLRGDFKWVSWKNAKPDLILGILAHGVWLSCVLLAISKCLLAGIVALIIALQPLATGALSGSVTGEHTSVKQWIGLIIGFLGVGLSVAFRIDLKNSTPVISYLLPLGSLIAITIASLYRRHIELNKKNRTLTSLLSLFYQGLGAAALLFIPAVLLKI